VGARRERAFAGLGGTREWYKSLNPTSSRQNLGPSQSGTFALSIPGSRESVDPSIQNGSGRDMNGSPGKQSIFAGKEEEEEDEVAGPAGDDEDTVVAVGVGRAQRQKRFYVTKGNQWDLVASVLEELGWQRIPFDHKDDLNFDLRWTEVRSDIEFARFREKEQLANHVPNASVVTTKHGLIKSLRALDRQRVREGKNTPLEEGGERGGGHGLMGMDEFVPPTYLLNVGADKLQLLHLLQQQLASSLVCIVACIVVCIVKSYIHTYVYTYIHTYIHTYRCVYY
jgi:hypothetical protein